MLVIGDKAMVDICTAIVVSAVPVVETLVPLLNVSIVVVYMRGAQFASTPNSTLLLWTKNVASSTIASLCIVSPAALPPCSAPTSAQGKTLVTMDVASVMPLSLGVSAQVSVGIANKFDLSLKRLGTLLVSPSIASSILVLLLAPHLFPPKWSNKSLVSLVFFWKVEDLFS